MLSDFVAHRALAALGEMLFYIAAQNNPSDLEPSSGMQWVMPSLYVNNMIAFLYHKNEAILVHYAAKTIENIMVQAGSTYVQLFNSKVKPRCRGGCSICHCSVDAVRLSSSERRKQRRSCFTLFVNLTEFSYKRHVHPP